MVDNLINGLYYVLLSYFVLKLVLATHTFFRISGDDPTNRRLALKFSVIVNNVALGIFCLFNCALSSHESGPYIKDLYLTNISTGPHVLAYPNVPAFSAVFLFAFIGVVGSMGGVHIAQALSHKGFWFYVYFFTYLINAMFWTFVGPLTYFVINHPTYCVMCREHLHMGQVFQVYNHHSHDLYDAVFGKKGIVGGTKTHLTSAMNVATFLAAATFGYLGGHKYRSIKLDPITFKVLSVDIDTLLLTTHASQTLSQIIIHLAVYLAIFVGHSQPCFLDTIIFWVAFTAKGFWDKKFVAKSIAELDRKRLGAWSRSGLH